MIKPKKNLKEILKDLNASQTKPKEISELPKITFSLLDDEINIDLEKNVLFQDVAFQLDFWGKTSVETSELLETTTLLLLENDYIRTMCKDLEDPSGFYRYVTRFEKKEE
ncbi:MAG: hypothetical protein IJO32_00635 [Bacilli bacterium]|nr:hypothetical protein [Bacilli bacterium]